MLQSMVIITKAPFVIALARTIVSMRFKPQTPRETQLVSVHIEMLREVNKIFVRQPLDPRGRGSDPTRPPRPPKPLGYFGLPMMNSGKPPLPPSMPYHHEYVKDSDLDIHVKVFRVAIRANGEIDDEKIINLFSFTLRDIMFNWCNNYMGDYPDYIFAKL